MKKQVMKYPKLKKRSTPETWKVQEPTRRTLFDRIKDNFKKLDRVTYMHRVIYIGEHNMPDCLSAAISSTMEVYDEHCSTERLTGFLVIYNNHFIHMIEGNEDTIQQHVKELLIMQEQDPKKLSNLKLLIQVSHVLKRLSKDWYTYEGRPSKLMTAIEDNTTEDIARQVYNCVRKIYALVQQYIKDLFGIVTDTVSVETPDHRPSVLSRDSSTKSAKSSSLKFNRSSVLSFARNPSKAVSTDRYRAYLPERELLEVLLESKLTMTMKKYNSLYALVPQRDIYKDKVWPVPGDFIPFDVFSTPYDMVTELPKPESSSQKREDEAALEEVSLEEETDQEETAPE